tara:strand:- start:41094 stop:41324 length:231 start_codon:yes stop_codon:yes gene_type:complete
MESMMQNLLGDEDLFIPLVIAVSILTGMLIQATTKVLTNSARERTKREIAAYVAEGSMTPEQAERILKAGNRGRVC